MPDIKKIDTTKFTSEGKVEVDGKIWTVKLPGAGTELQLSKAQRRIAFLDKKIEKGDYTEADVDKYDELEDFYFSFFKHIFKDETPDNSEVNTWLNETPLSFIYQAFQDIKEQSKEGDVPE